MADRIPENRRIPRRDGTARSSEQSQEASGSTAFAVLTSSLARLSDSTEMRDFLAHVMGEIVRVTGAANAALTRYQPAGHTLVLELFHDGQTPRWGPAAKELPLWGQPYDADITPAFRIGLRERHIFVASMMPVQSDVSVDDFALPGGLEWMSSIGGSDTAVALLISGSQPVGTFHLHFTGGKILRPADLPLLEALLQHAALALRVEKLAEESRQAAVARETERVAQEQAAQARRVSEFLIESVRDLSSGNDISTVLESFLEHILRAGMQMLDGAIAQIFLYEPATGTLSASVGVDREHRIYPAPGLMKAPPDAEPFPVRHTDVWRRLTSTREVLQWDADRDGAGFWPGTPEWHLSMDHRGTVCVAMMVGDEPIGMLALAFQERDVFTQGEFEFVKAMGQQASLAIQLSRLSEEAKEAAVFREREKAAQDRAAELNEANLALSRSVERLTRASGLREFLDAVLRESIRVSKAASGSVFLYDDAAQGYLPVAMVLGGESLDIAGDTRIAPWRTPAPGQPGVRQNLEDFVWADYRKPRDEEHWPAAYDFHKAHGHGLVAAVGISLGGGIAGFFCLAFDKSVDFEDGRPQLNLCRVLAQQCALAIRLSRLAEQATEMAVARVRENAAQERVAELTLANEAISGALQRMTTEFNVSRAPGVILLEIARLAGATVCCWLDYDADRNALNMSLCGRDGVLLDSFGPEQPAAFRTPFDADVTEGFRYLQSRDELVEMTSPENRDKMWPGVLDWHRQNGRNAVYSFGVRLGDQPLGALGMAFRERPGLSKTQTDLIRTLTNHFALAVHLSRLSRTASVAAMLDERNRIAREIHDSLAQAITGILMQLQAASRFADKNPEVVLACVARAESLAREGLKQARRSVMALAQPEEQFTNLGESLGSLVETATADTGIRAEVRVSGEPRPLEPVIAVNLLRICQEALSNAQRYADATTITVRLAFEPGLVRLEIRDDGIGFILSEARDIGFGLAGMKRRAERIGARLSIHTAPRAGTRVAVEAPLETSSSEHLKTQNE